MDGYPNLLGGKLGGRIEINRTITAPLGFGVNGDITDAGQGQQAAAHFIGNRIRILHRELRGNTYMQVNRHIINDATAADPVVTFHPFDAGNDFANLRGIQGCPVNQGGNIFPDRVNPNLGDHTGDEDRHQRVGPGITQLYRAQTEQHRAADPNTGQRVARIGIEHFAAQLFGLAQFPPTGAALDQRPPHQRTNAPPVDRYRRWREEPTNCAGR